MRSPITCQTASLDERIAAQRSAVADMEKALWAGGLNEPLLAAYQGAFRQLEQLIAARGDDDRHRFVIVIPVADRPQQTRSCLDSLLELCQAFAYGGLCDGAYPKISVVIADDSSDEGHIAGNREIARHFSQLGIATAYFGLDEQFAVLAALGADARAELSGILGSAGREAFSHKGHAITRNIAYLMLGDAKEYDERTLIYTVDSDQEFKVKVGTPDGDKEVCAINFFHHLDRIFAATDALVLTGKVVGDPPVSPSVMAGNFLQDVIGFLQQMAAGIARNPCRHHQGSAHREGEASYHDMADLFGFKPASEAYCYRCTLTGEHTDADCFDDFSNRLNSFFYGEHPTRISYYCHDEVSRTVQAARTVYAGNYIFRRAGLKYFIPFAPLRLRMSGPVLGRLVKSEIKGRFVSANLPMLHKRTVRGTGQSEFRPGVCAARAETRAVELCDEFERQFHGDIMLFSIERLTALGYPQQPLPAETVAATLASVREEMQQKYNARRRDIVEKLERLRSMLRDPANWWNTSTGHAAAVENFKAFADNIARNFGADAPCYDFINSAANWEKWQARLLVAICRYPQERRAWAAALAATPAAVATA
ncbi:MAG: hypothetical protein M0Q22_14535 [Sulfuritalea sp.]|jgi:hypothetical protein|nr:hypothetical protein [Sulfuritalea sp.]